MYVIGFNGPPQCGKDTLSGFFREYVEERHPILPIMEVSLSTPLRVIAYAMAGRHYPDPSLPYEEFKNTAYPQFGWSKFKSQQHAIGRELMIDVSERFLKPCYGQDIMAKLLRASVPLSFDGLILIRDSGFQCEVDPIIEWVGAENFLVCQVFRDGFDSFENDSREWVWNNYTVERFRRVGGEAGSMVPMTTMITNAGTLDQLKVEAGRLYGRCVNSRGWTF